MRTKLPDCRQVMKYVMYLRNDSENTKQKVKNEEIAYNVVDSVVFFWNMARIKTKYRHHCMSDVMKLWNKWQGMLRNKWRQSDPRNRRANIVVWLDNGHSFRYWCTRCYWRYIEVKASVSKKTGGSWMLFRPETGKNSQHGWSRQ